LPAIARSKELDAICEELRQLFERFKQDFHNPEAVNALGNSTRRAIKEKGFTPSEIAAKVGQPLETVQMWRALLARPVLSSRHSKRPSREELEADVKNINAAIAVVERIEAAKKAAEVCRGQFIHNAHNRGLSFRKMNTEFSPQTMLNWEDKRPETEQKFDMGKITTLVNELCCALGV
jgi:hypothetical protein